MNGVYTEEITNTNRVKILTKVLKSINSKFSQKIKIKQFHDNGEGVDRVYDVYKVILDTETYILKNQMTMKYMFMKIFSKIKIYQYLNFMDGQVLME